MKQNTTLHCSQIGNLLDCSWRKAFETNDKKTVSAASLVGGQAHKIMAGEELEHQPEGQAVITYDTHTPSRRDIDNQAIACARDFSAYIDSKGWQVIERELALEWQFEAPDGNPVTLKGRIDAVCRDQSGCILIVDYKTGSNVNDVILQLAAYMWLWDNNNAQEAAGVAWLWRQRGLKGRLKTGFMDREVVSNVLPFMIDAYRNSVEPAPNPKSMSCTYCAVSDCIAAAARWVSI